MPKPLSQGPWSWHTVLVIKDIAWTAQTLNGHLNIIYIIIIRLTVVGCLKRLFHWGNNSFVTSILWVHLTGSSSHILEETLCQWWNEPSCSLKKTDTILQTTLRPVFLLISILALGRPVLVTLPEVNEVVLETIKPSMYKTGTANGKKRSCDQVGYPLFHQIVEGVLRWIKIEMCKAKTGGIIHPVL